jgi:hypothetical protein
MKRDIQKKPSALCVTHYSAFDSVEQTHSQKWYCEGSNLGNKAILVKFKPQVTTSKKIDWNKII